MYLLSLFATVTIASASLATTATGPAGSPSPAPCASGAPVAGAPATPAPCPSAAPGMSTIGRVKSRGRIDNLIGTASSAAEGFVGHAELEARPILRPGELMETVPGGTNVGKSAS